MRLETIKIGRIVNAHGIRGEVRVQPDGQDPAFLTQFQTFYLDGAPVTPTANHCISAGQTPSCRRAPALMRSCWA